ncbi:caspase family protein [Pirellulaceae bacterium SH449]
MKQELQIMRIQKSIFVSSRCLIAFVILVFASLSTSLAQEVSGKYALLVAVTKYDHAEMNGQRPLKYPEQDALALGQILEKASYEVEYLLGKQATKLAIEAKLDGLRRKANSDGICLVGFFGHGVEVEQSEIDGTDSIVGCFCPFDTEVRQASDKDGKLLYNGSNPMIDINPESLITMEQVLRALKIAKAGNRVVIADCCREMPNRARSRNLGLGASFKASDLPSGTVVLFGCKPGEKAFERDDWKHGAFTKSLLEEIERLGKNGPVTTGILADSVKINVQRLTGRQQTPTPFAVDSFDLMLESYQARTKLQENFRIHIDTIGRGIGTGKRVAKSSYSPDRKMVSIGASVYDVPSNSLVLHFSEFSKTGASSFISSDGRRLLVEDFEKSIVFDLERKQTVRSYPGGKLVFDKSLTLYAEFLDGYRGSRGGREACVVRTIDGDEKVFFKNDVSDLIFSSEGQHLWITTESQHLRYPIIHRDTGQIVFSTVPDRTISRRGFIDAVLQDPDHLVINKSDHEGNGSFEVFDASKELILGSLSTRTTFGFPNCFVNVILNHLSVDIRKSDGKTEEATYSLPGFSPIQSEKFSPVVRPSRDNLYSIEPLSKTSIAIGSSDSICPPCGFLPNETSRLFTFDFVSSKRQYVFEDGPFVFDLSKQGDYLNINCDTAEWWNLDTMVWNTTERKVLLKSGVASNDGGILFENKDTSIFLQTGDAKRTLTAVKGKAIMSSSDGKKLVVRNVTNERELDYSVLDVESGDVLKFGDGKSVIQISRDGAKALLQSKGDAPSFNTVYSLFDMKEGREIAKLESISNKFNSVSASFSSTDSSRIAVSCLAHFNWGDDMDRIEIVDSINGRSILTIHPDERAGDVKWSEDGAKLVGVVRDGSIRWWDSKNGDEIARLYLLDAGSEWIATTKDFRFDCSPGAQRYLKVLTENSPEVIDGSGLLTQTPGLLETLLR